MTPTLRLAVLTTALSASIGLSLSAGPDYPVRDEHSVVKTLRFAGTGIRTLDVRAIHGSIRVTGYNGRDVIVKATRTTAAATQEDLRAAERDVIMDSSDNAADLHVTVRELDRPLCGDSGNWRSAAWGERRRYEVTFEFIIQVPTGTRLRLCSIDGGEVRVEGTEGDFDIGHVNGRITMERVRGTGRARTVNGSVTVSFDESPRGDAEFKTVNGEVAVTFPAGLSADLRMKTFHGDLLTDFDVDVLPQNATLTGDRKSGRFVYRSNQFTTVRVGRGGPSLTFETLNGNVRVLRAAR